MNFDVQVVRIVPVIQIQPFRRKVIQLMAAASLGKISVLIDTQNMRGAAYQPLLIVLFVMAVVTVPCCAAGAVIVAVTSIDTVVVDIGMDIVAAAASKDVIGPIVAR